MTQNEALAVAKPILFNTEMVEAILGGRKTITRRIALPNKDLHEFHSEKYPDGWWIRGRVCKDWDTLLSVVERDECKCRYRKGDILYVRETWKQAISDPAGGGYALTDTYLYKADCKAEPKMLVETKWHPSIHMPKEAARIFLRVTNVRVEKLQDITVNQSTKEGCVSPCCMCRNKKDGKCVGDSILLRDCPIDRIYSPFIEIWNTTVKKSDLELYGWEANPWVRVVEFEKIEVT